MAARFIGGLDRSVMSSTRAAQELARVSTGELRDRIACPRELVEHETRQSEEVVPGPVLGSLTCSRCGRPMGPEGRAVREYLQNFPVTPAAGIPFPEGVVSLEG